MNLNGKLFHQHDSDNVFDHTFIDIGLFNTDLQDELKMSVRKIERKRCGQIWSLGRNYVRLYRDGRQISESPQDVHKRGEIRTCVLLSWIQMNVKDMQYYRVLVRIC